MVRLVRVELRRLLARRAVRVLLAACLLLPLLIGVGVAIDTRPPSDADLAWATEQAEKESESKWVKREVRRCVKDPSGWGGLPTNLSAEEAQEACEEQALPQVEWYLWYQPLDLAEQRDGGSGLLLTLVLAFLLLVAGTTFIGHDWSSGSVSNQILFEPRRGRVWSAKATAVVATSFLLAALAQTAYWLGLAALARHRGEPHGRALLIDCLQFGLRAAAVAAAAALIGFALTMLLRSTVATLGITFGIALAGGMVLAVIGVSDVWNPAFNLWAVVSNGVSYDAEIACRPPSSPGEMCWEQRHLSLTRGATYAGSVVAAVTLVSWFSFRRRDIN